MGKSRLKVSRINGRRYRYPYPVYFRPPLRWITSSFTAKKVAVVARDFGPQILRAIHQNDLEFLQRILERRLKADFLITKLCTMDVGHRIRSRRASCPLIVAAQKKDPTILQYMLEKGADPNYVESKTHDLYRFCAIHASVRRGLLKTTSALLDANANPNVLDSRGESPLHIAVRANDSAMVKLLLLHGADPKTGDRHGNTPLHIATRNGHSEIVSLLLVYGGRLNVPNQRGELPVHVAACSGHAHLVKALSVPNANIPCVINGVMQYPLHLAAENGNAEAAQALLESGADVNVKDSGGNTALHRLVLKPYEHSTMRDMNYFLGVAIAVIKAGINVNESNTQGETALSLASSNHFPAVAKLIHSSGNRDFRLDPEMLQQILIEQNILSSDDHQKRIKPRAPETDSPKPFVPSSKQETHLGNIPKSLHADTNGEIEGKKSVQNVHSKSEKESQQKDEDGSTVGRPPLPSGEVKRYPLRKSDLWNYQQFPSNSKQQDDISSFTVATNKGAERMCIVFDKSSPNTQKVVGPVVTKKGTEYESRYSGQTKRPPSVEITKPSTRRSTSAENRIQEKENDQRLSLSELKLPDGEKDLRKNESYLYRGKARSEQTLGPTGVRPNEEESLWIEHKVERYTMVSPVNLKDIGRDSITGLRYYSKSPSGFLSEGGGLRRLKLRVAGEVPKAYTCKQKAAARRAFFLARPVGIENVGDYDRGHLSMSSLPEFGGEAWEKAMQRRLEWTEPLQPVFGKHGSLPSAEFPAAPMAQPMDKMQHITADYRIAGLCPQPYKSFGKIETKTDAIEEAMLDYETEEEYESDGDDDDDLERGMGESFDEKAQHEWEETVQEPADHFDKNAEYVSKVSSLDISLNDSFSSIEADVLAERILKELRDAKEIEEPVSETRHPKEDVLNDDRAKRHQAHVEYNDQDDANNVGRNVPSGKVNAALLNLLHGYHPRRNKYETMVVSSVEPEIQRLTVDNIVVADIGSSEDDRDSDRSVDETEEMPQNLQANENSVRVEVDVGVDRRKADAFQRERVDKEIKGIMKSSAMDIPVQQFETVSIVQEPQLQSRRNKEKQDDVVKEQFGVADSVKRNPNVEEMVVGADDNKFAKETEMNIMEQRKVVRKKSKKGKQKHAENTEEATGNEDFLNEDAAQVTESHGKLKKKAKKGKQEKPREEVEEPESRMQRPEEEMVTSKLPTGRLADISNEDDSFGMYADEPGSRQHWNERDRLLDMNDREKGEDSPYDAYAEEAKRRTAHGRQHQDEEHDAMRMPSEEKNSQETEKETVKRMKTKPKEADAGIQASVDQEHKEEPQPQKIRKKRVDEVVLIDPTEHEDPNGQQELKNTMGDDNTADTIVGRSKTTKTKHKKRKDIPVATEDLEELEKNQDHEKTDENLKSQVHLELETILPHADESSDQRTLKDVDSNKFSNTYNGNAEEYEILDVENSENKVKQEKKKRKKKIRDKSGDVIEQQMELDDDHSVPTAEESIGNSLSRETGSRKTPSQSGDSGSVMVEPVKVKKTKKSTPKDKVSKEAWNSGSIHDEVWQEAMKEEPLASSETIYDAVLSDEVKVKKNDKTVKAKKQKDSFAKNGFPNNQHISDFDNESLQANNKLSDSQTTDDPAMSYTSRPIKETDIDDEIANWENFANSINKEEKFESSGMKTPDSERRTIETSVDDIFDDAEDIKGVVAVKVAALYDLSNEINIPPPSDRESALHISAAAGKQTPVETNIDDDYDELPAYPEAEEFESAVEKSLETNIDEYIEQFSSFVSKESSFSDVDKKNRLNVKDPVTSRASKVTNIDDFHVEAVTLEQLKQQKQNDSIVSSKDGANFTEVTDKSHPEEPFEKPSHKKGAKKKGQKVEKSKKLEENENYVDEKETKDRAIESDEIIPHSTKIRKVKKKKNKEDQIEDNYQQETGEELLDKNRRDREQRRPVKETSIDDDIYLSCEDELKPVTERVIDGKNFDNKLKQEIDDKIETVEDHEERLDHHVKVHKQKKPVDYLKIKRFEENESVENEDDLKESTPKTFSLGTGGTKKQTEKEVMKKGKDVQPTELGSDVEYRRQKKTKKHAKEETVHKPAPNFDLQTNKEARTGYTETEVDDEDIQGLKKMKGEIKETDLDGSGHDEDWNEEIIPDVKHRKLAAAKNQLESFIPSDQSEDDGEEDERNAQKTFNLENAGTKRLPGAAVKTAEQKDARQTELLPGDDFDQYKRAKKTKKHAKENDVKSKNGTQQREEKEQENILLGKEFKKTAADEEFGDVHQLKSKGKQIKETDFAETGFDEDWHETETRKEANKKFASVTEKLERFSDDDKSEEDVEEDEGHAPKTFSLGTGKAKKPQDKSLSDREKKIKPSDEFEEYKRGKKTKKHVKEMIPATDDIGPNETKLDKKVSKGKEHVKTEDDDEFDDSEKHKHGISQVKETDFIETGIDDDWHEDDAHETKSKKFHAVKNELERFSVSHESDDDVEDVENASKSFGKDAGKAKKSQEKPFAAKETEPVDEYEQYQRRKNPKRPTLRTSYEQDVSEEDAKMASEETEKFKKISDKETEVDQKTVHYPARQKGRSDMEHKRSNETNLDEEEEEEEGSSDEEEFKELNLKKIPSVKRYEDSNPSDESEDEGEDESAPKSFSVSAGVDVKKIVAEPIRDEPADDFEEFQRRKKPKRPAAKAVIEETNVDEDLDERELELKENKASAIKGKVDDIATDEDSYDEEIPVVQRKPIEIKKFKKEFVSSKESDEELEEEKDVPKTFKIGGSSGQKVAGKQNDKGPRKEVTATEDDYTRRHHKTPKQTVIDVKKRLSSRDEDESGTDEMSDEDRDEYEKISKKRFELSRFKEDSSLSKESDDNEEIDRTSQDVLPVKSSDNRNKMQNNISNAKAGEYSDKKTRIEPKEEDEWSNEDSDDEEAADTHPKVKPNVAEVKQVKDGTLKQHPVAKKGGSEELQDEEEEDEEEEEESSEEEKEETSNKDVESEEDVEILGHKRRPKSSKVRQASSSGPKVQNGGLHFATASQQQKSVTETNIDNVSESDGSFEQHERITAKIESLLRQKNQFTKNEYEMESDEPSLIKDDDIAILKDSTAREISKQTHGLRENVKKNIKETSFDDEIPYDSQIRKTKTAREANGEKENVDIKAKSQQGHRKQERRSLETDDSEEVVESFSRNQPGRVTRVRQKKGTRKTVATVDASSNADTEGESTEDSRRRSAGMPSAKKWTTTERNQIDTEITNKSVNHQTSTPNTTSFNQKPHPSISPLSDDNFQHRNISSKSKTQENFKGKLSEQAQKADDDASNDLDLDASIRRKRRMEMTEDVTTTVTTKTTSVEKQTDESLYSLPNRQRPKKRDILPMGLTSTSMTQETVSDVDPSPARNKRLDMSLPENLSSRKNDSFSKGNSLDASLSRKSTATDRSSQHRPTRQHSAENLPHHQQRLSESEAKKVQMDANFLQRRQYGSRSRSASNLDSRASYNGPYRMQRDVGQRPISWKQPNKSLTEVAFETIAANSVNERHLLKKILTEKPVVYTRGIYRPQPMYWRGGGSRGTNPNDESRISNRPQAEQLGMNELYAEIDDMQNKSSDSLDKSKQNLTQESSPTSPPQLSSSRDALSRDEDNSEKRGSAFVAYNRRVTIHENQQRQPYVGNRRRHRHHRSVRNPYPESFKAPRITEPIAVDFSKYGLLAQIWMEQVDMKTVLKSKTMYLTVMPAGVQPPDNITKSIKYVPTGDDLTLPPQWVIARGRTFRQQKRQLDEYRYRMSEGHNLSDSDLDLSRSGRPMSPGGRQELLFFKVGGRWPELAWVLFEGVQNDSATVRMVKDIQLKNPSKLTDQIQDMMTRWWNQKGEAATIEELKRSLDIINIPFIQDETFNPRLASSFFEEEPKLMLEEVDSRDPDVSRMIQEYNLNASFHVDQRRSPHTPQAFNSNALLQQTQLKGLEMHSSPNLRHSRHGRISESHDDSQARIDSKDVSVARLNSRNASFRPFSSQDSLDAENLGDDKRKSFTVVQSKPKTKGKKDKFRHESNI